jgi:hypothetical protein
MSKIRNAFLQLLAEEGVNPEFANKLKNFFGNTMEPGETYPNGEAVMTYKDAISHLQNIIKHVSTYDDNDYVDKEYWIDAAKKHIDALNHQQYQLHKKPDDKIASFGEFFSSFIRRAGDAGYLDQYTKEYLSQPKEDVQDFNTISDTYRMQDMPQ